MNPDSNKISTNTAEEILLNLFGLKGSAKELPGEVDMNFRIKVAHGEGYILKISKPTEDIDILDFQQSLLEHIDDNDAKIMAPVVIKDKETNSISQIADTNGQQRFVRLLTWVPGRLWSSVNPQLDELRFSLGEQCGILTKALSNLDHPKAHREFVWDVAQSLWTKEHLDLYSGDQKEIITYFQGLFESSQDTYV